MISFKSTSGKGQATLELALTGSVFFLLAAIGISIILHALSSVVATRWASKNSRCVAIKNGQEFGTCERLTAAELHRYFKFQSLHVSTSITHGVIKSVIEARFPINILSKEPVAIHGVYELFPYEYKEVGQ